MIDLKKKVGPLPLWAYGVGAAVGAVGIFLLRKKGGAGTGDGSTQGIGSDGYYADEGNGGGGYGGGSPGDSPGGGGGGTTVVTRPDAPEQVTGSPAPPPIQNPSSRSDTPTMGLPIPAGIVTAVSRITNPVGYTRSEELNPNNHYTASALDFATELPGGIGAYQMAQDKQAAAKGQTFTVYQAPITLPQGQAGKIVDAAHRITGERYLQLANGKYQVIN